MAFQKWKGLPSTTVVDNATAIALNTQTCRPAAGRSSGTLLEVDKGKQIAYVIQNGQMKYIFNVSTGNGRSYDEEDQKSAGARVIGIAITPTGTFRTYRESDVARYEGDLGSLYRPKFVVGGVAVHGAPRAQLPRIARLHPGGEPGDGPHLGPEPAAVGLHRLDPRLAQRVAGCGSVVRPPSDLRCPDLRPLPDRLEHHHQLSSELAELVARRAELDDSRGSQLVQPPAEQRG